MNKARHGSTLASFLEAEGLTEEVRRRVMERRARVPTTLGEILASKRAERGETLRGFGDRLGVSGAFLCDVEKGRRSISLSRLGQWAHVLGLPPKQLLEYVLQFDVDAARLPYAVRVKDCR